MSLIDPENENNDLAAMQKIDSKFNISRPISRQDNFQPLDFIDISVKSDSSDDENTKK